MNKKDVLRHLRDEVPYILTWAELRRVYFPKEDTKLISCNDSLLKKMSKNRMSDTVISVNGVFYRAVYAVDQYTGYYDDDIEDWHEVSMKEEKINLYT